MKSNWKIRVIKWLSLALLPFLALMLVLPFWPAGDAQDSYRRPAECSDTPVADNSWPCPDTGRHIVIDPGPGRHAFAPYNPFLSEDSGSINRWSGRTELETPSVRSDPIDALPQQVTAYQPPATGLAIDTTAIEDAIRSLESQVRSQRYDRYTEPSEVWLVPYRADGAMDPLMGRQQIYPGSLGHCCGMER